MTALAVGVIVTRVMSSQLSAVQHPSGDFAQPGKSEALASKSCAQKCSEMELRVTQRGETGIQTPTPESVTVPGSYPLDLIVMYNGGIVGCA